MVERVLGKDEVAGSTPVSGSMIIALIVLKFYIGSLLLAAMI